MHFYTIRVIITRLYYFNTLCLYGSHRVVFTNKQTTLIQPNTTQVYFSLVTRTCNTTCFGLYLGHPEACRYKTHTKEGTIRI